ncbi:TPA: peptidoglycan-binding protein [Vibrio parahaemolyticus]|nr:peptidoglycan-binding protein [Vibrio parahaemolyticus]
MKQAKQAVLLLSQAKALITRAQRTMLTSHVNVVSIAALTGRANATLFNGQMNEVQRQCLLGFSIVYQMLNALGFALPVQYLAYVLATTYHETARTMQPIEEYGKGAGHEYGEPHEMTGQTYYGRGYVQLTWYDNYFKAMRYLYSVDWAKGAVDLVNHPELALKPFYAAQIAIIGMAQGWFTGKQLSDYVLQDGSYDYVNARRIINGTDKAETIAAYAIMFENALRLSAGQDIHRETIKIGASGDDVRELQQGLNVNPDGLFGSATKTALMNFQNQHNLAADGVCGSATWAKFDKEIYKL